VGSTPEMIVSSQNESVLNAVENLKSFDGVVVYQCPVTRVDEEHLLIGSAQFQMAAKVQNNDKITVCYQPRGLSAYLCSRR